MGDPKVTIMVIKVDLQCEKCYKKIKKILCKIPQIRDQIFDEKKNTVTIKVVCCSPERVKQKICCKGGDTIKGIEIVEPPKPKPPEKPKQTEKKPDQTEKKPEKPKEPEKKPDKPKEIPIPVPVLVPIRAPKPKAQAEPKLIEPKAPAEPKLIEPKAPAEPNLIELKAPAEPKPVEPDPIIPVAYFPPPIQGGGGLCCGDCWQGIPGGPCYYGGTPVQPYYDPCIYGRPVYNSWGGGGYWPSSCGECISEENPSACSIM